MTKLVSSGQITIVDNNDARPISAVIIANKATQQIYTKDESAIIYTPNWATSPLVLTAKVYVGASGGAVESAAILTNRRWSTDLSTSLGSGTTYSVDGNLPPNSSPVTYYFEGDYTDPVSDLVSHVVASIVISQIKTGTNAVYVQLRGVFSIEQSTSAEKNNAVVIADLMRASGVDDSGVTYRWYRPPHDAANIIDGTLGSVNTLFGLQDTAAVNAKRVGEVGQYQTGSGSTYASITSTNVPNSAFTDSKALVISELAVQDMAVFKVEVKDSDGSVYQNFFTIYDISDPYDVKLISSAGDKLQNGVGSTSIYPDVFYGSQRVASLTGWVFNWYFYDRNGDRGAFIDTSRTALAGGRDITANTTGESAVFTYSGTAIVFSAGDIIKCTSPNSSDARFYEVLSGTGNTVKIRVPVDNTWLSFTTFKAPVNANGFVGGKLFVCTPDGMRVTTGSTKITVTGDEIDAKGRIFCEANRP